MKKLFKIESSFTPAGDQPKAIELLSNGINAGHTRQVLLGVTGSGKTFTMAKVVEQVQKLVRSLYPVSSCGLGPQVAPKET